MALTASFHQFASNTQTKSRATHNFHTNCTKFFWSFRLILVCAQNPRPALDTGTSFVLKRLASYIIGFITLQILLRLN